MLKFHRRPCLLLVLDTLQENCVELQTGRRRNMMRIVCVVALIAVAASAADELSAEEQREVAALLARFKAEKSAGSIQGPLITTLEGGIDIIPGDSKDVCFGPAGCVADIINGIAEGVNATSAAKAAAMAAVAQVEAQLTEQGGIIAAQKTKLETQQTALEKLAASDAVRQAKLEKLAASDAMRCGRPCYPGEHVQQPCTADKPGTCAPCKSSTFSLGGRPAVCTPCTVCNPFQFQAAGCSKVLDTQCRACKTCPTSKYAKTRCSDDKTTEHCASVTACKQGVDFQVAAPTLSSDRKCQQCTKGQEGEFSVSACTTTKNAVWKTCTKCAVITTAACTATKDAVCATFLNGAAKETAAKNCRVLYKTWKPHGTPKSGIYWINPEGRGKAIFRVYCDMEERKWNDGAGWTLVFVQEGSPYRSWHSNCPEKELLDPRQKGGGCAAHLSTTLGKAKYIRYTDLSKDFTPILLAEFQSIGDYYKKVFVGGNDRAVIRYPKSTRYNKNWVSILAQRKNFGHVWGHYGWPWGGHNCWEDTNARDRPWYRYNGGSHCYAYSPAFPYSGANWNRGGNANYAKWIMEAD